LWYNKIVQATFLKGAIKMNVKKVGYVLPAETIVKLKKMAKKQAKSQSLVLREIIDIEAERRGIK
jgi:predicted DNA-binding protein